MFKKNSLILLLILFSIIIFSAQDVNEVDFYQMLLDEIDQDIDEFEFKKSQFFERIDIVKKSDGYNNKIEQDINKTLDDFKKYKKEYFKLLNKSGKLISKIDKEKYNKAYIALYDNEEYNTLSLKFYNLSEEIKIYQKDMLSNKKVLKKVEKLSDELSEVLDKLEEIEYKLLPVEYSKYDLKSKIINYLDFEKTFYDKKNEILEKINELTLKIFKIESQMRKEKIMRRKSI